MKIERNKLIFISIIGLVAIFIVCYYVYVMDSGNNSDTELKQTTVPELQGEQKEYESKLDAVNDVKEERESNAPSVYNESLLDSTGVYDPLLKEKERERIVDSIYREGRIDYESGSLRNSSSAISKTPRSSRENQEQTVALDFEKAHEEFFSFEPTQIATTKLENVGLETDAFILVEVNGEQTVKKDSRLELRLAVDAIIKGKSIPRNSLIYGFVSFRANRVSIKITSIKHTPVNLKAYDLLDGNEGIYVRNSFTSEASREVIRDIVEDINIPGVPQVGGIKKVFQRNNRNVKATIYNQYQLILKPGL